MTPDPLQCLTCGAVVLGGSRFCGQCGADFRRAPAAVAAKTVLSAPPRRRDPHRHRNAAWILGGMAAVVVLIFGALMIAGAIDASKPRPDDIASGTVWLRACSACGGDGKVSTGIEWARDNPCHTCYGTGTVFDHTGETGSANQIPISHRTWNSMVRDRELWEKVY